MARLTDDADYDAGETSGNAPQKNTLATSLRDEETDNSPPRSSSTDPNEHSRNYWLSDAEVTTYLHEMAIRQNVSLNHLKEHLLASVS
ncbi:unnamed protein product [Protopolystoma xenopodis]|uniref:Uncharacterized protein n=1 Tax=Protopolystoma xenopodis TaxID=117903 RepID=A0A448XGY6_9PLAT|nr:unnamed protein product [Protopolystoma xenopodis]